MKILINASNLREGGALQVTDSICCSLGEYAQHQFVVVLSHNLQSTYERIKRRFDHVEVYTYDIRNSLSTLLWGRDAFLDGLVREKHIDCVLTVFGPSRWNPKCKHLSGFAMPHLVLSNSPYFTRMNWFNQMKHHFRNKFLTYFFRRSTTFFYTENPYISHLLSGLIKGVNVYTVTNYYNQIFEDKKVWKNRKLPSFSGVTLLTISANFEHKNFPIALEILKQFQFQYPKMKLRFVLTIEKRDFPPIPEELQDSFLFLGRVDISECPSLYQQADIMFQPSLLECFTATYPEAMKMEVPIVTTDIEFARGLCDEAAVYYNPLSAESAASAIYKVSTDQGLRKELIENGRRQLLKYDNYKQRTQKLMTLIESIVNKSE